ncbi:prophage tail gpP-like protein [Sphingomonas sp. BE270]|jgi:prophage tail gpP-like protein|uniref:phage baseplate assembly protein n=1 Tax=unclassified Sphingomonas TaxID=196159 RepID=UPI0006896514|nr:MULTISPECIES: hypothetical protein [unclassified Sphingomonas]MDR7259881.1 prophage tail gpP-like protein [Sphingomonas sp. BE270]
MTDAHRPDGDLSIEVGGNAITGWEAIDVTLRAEAFPNSFAIGLSSKEPITSKAVVAKAGDPCVIKIGSDTVITGYVDRDSNTTSADGHTLSLIGRGKTQDLTDCSAEWKGGQILSATGLEIAKKLAAPYGIEVKLAAGADAGQPVPQTNITYGETAAGIIQRNARNAGLLAYEDSDGALLLARVGTVKAASGVKYGVNVLDSSVTNAMDQRYSEVRCAALSQNTFGDIAGGDDSFFYFTASDPNVPRHRLMYLVTEAAFSPRFFTELKAKWEVARRAGRAGGAFVTIDSWRDSAGTLWKPNTLIDVDVPGLRGEGQMCISEVTFHRSSERGTVADLFVMPPSAFAPEPISLTNLNTADIAPDSTSQLVLP